MDYKYLGPNYYISLPTYGVQVYKFSKFSSIFFTKLRYIDRKMELLYGSITGPSV